jgi:hypothetical protein
MDVSTSEQRPEASTMERHRAGRPPRDRVGREAHRERRQLDADGLASAIEERPAPDEELDAGSITVVRRAVVETEDPELLDAVRECLPENYRAYPLGRKVEIVGTDVPGRTLDGYVIPRLTSALGLCSGGLTSSLTPDSSVCTDGTTPTATSARD